MWKDNVWDIIGSLQKNPLLSRDLRSRCSQLSAFYFLILELIFKIVNWQQSPLAFPVHLHSHKLSRKSHENLWEMCENHETNFSTTLELNLFCKLHFIHSTWCVKHCKSCLSSHCWLKRLLSMSLLYISFSLFTVVNLLGGFSHNFVSVPVYQFIHLL